MNVVLVMDEVSRVANAMIGESALPDFFRAAGHQSKGVGVSAFDELNGVLEGYVLCRREEQVNMLGHYNESVDLESAFATIAVESFQEESHVVLDNEQPAAVPS